MSTNMILKFFENYGLIMTLLATSGIAFVGALKSIGLFSKLNPISKKYVYFACSCIASIISCTIYLCVKNAFVWANWGITVACVIGFTISIYGLYENIGIRTLLKKIFFTPIKNLLKNVTSAIFSKGMSKEKLLQLAKNLGTDILMQLANEIEQEKVIADNKMTNEDTQDSISTPIDTSKNTESSVNYINTNFFS